MLNQDSIEAKFIDSWQRHDIVSLTDLFSEDFVYITNGAQRFSNIKELRNFWCLNKRRQFGLSISARSGGSITGNGTVLFSAQFYNPLRCSINNVHGCFIVKHDNGKIFHFEEEYTRDERFNITYSFGALYRFALKPVLQSIISFALTILKALSSLWRVMIWALFIVFVAYFSVSRYFQEIIAFLPSGARAFLDEISPLVFVFAFIVSQIVPKLNFINKDIEVKKIKKNEDIQSILREIRSADSVTIVSGDFSFIDSYPAMEERLLDLAYQKKLRLFSYKDKDAVESEMKSNSKTAEIYLKLLDDKKIHFDCGVKLKFTLIDTQGVKRMLFRFVGKDKNHEPVDYIGVMKDRPNNKYIIEIIEQLISKVAS